MGTPTTTATTAAIALPGTGLATSWDASALAPEDWLVGAFLASTRTPNTRQAYARDIADWRGWLAERGVGLLGASRVVVDLYARHAAEVRALSPATVARRLSALTRLYRYAVAVELLERNPLEGIDRPRVGEDTTSTGLDRRELAALVTAAGASSARDYALVLLLALNGLRASELCALDIGDLDTERGHRVLRIVRKGGRRAIVPLAPQAVDALEQVLDQLRRAWTEQARASEQLAQLEPRLARAQADATRSEHNEGILAPLREQVHTTRTAADAAEQQAAVARGLLEQRAEQIAASLRASWDTDRPVAAEAARTVKAGAGWLGRLTGARANVRDAERLLSQWAEKWRPVKPELTDAAAAARFAGWHPGNDRIAQGLDQYAHHRAGGELPEQLQLIRTAEQARQNAQNAAHTYAKTSGPLIQRQALLHARSGYRDLADELPHLTEQAATARARLDVADKRVEQHAADPAITGRDDPAGLLAAAHTSWHGDYLAAQAAALQRARHAAAQEAQEAARQHMRAPIRHYRPSYGPTTGRDGPSLGR